MKTRILRYFSFIALAALFAVEYFLYLKPTHRTLSKEEIENIRATHPPHLVVYKGGRLGLKKAPQGKQDEILKTLPKLGLGNDGMTLIELMIVIAIIGMLATMASQQYEIFALKAQQVEAKTILYDINDRVEIFVAEYGRYPEIASTTLQPLSGGNLLVDVTSMDVTTCGQSPTSLQEVGQWCGAHAGECVGAPQPGALDSSSDCDDLGLQDLRGTYYSFEFVSLGQSNPYTSLFIAKPAWAAAAVKKTPYNGKYEVYRFDSSGHFCSPYNDIYGQAKIGKVGLTRCEQTWDGSPGFYLWF